MPVTRREFLLQSGRACLGYAVGAAAFTAGVARFSLINAFAQGTDYRALVCVFLAGGNDGNNVIVPTTTTEYNQYATVRNSSGLAIAQSALLPIVPSSIGSGFGLHPSLVELADLWTRQRLSVVTNVGPLTQPLTREDYRAGAPRPYQLFSHSDQIAQWQSAIADRVSPTGWGGRIADRTPLHASGLPTDHGGQRRPLHPRPEHVAALDRARADGAQSGAGAEWIRHRGRRGRTPELDAVPAHDRHRPRSRRRGQPNGAAGGGYRRHFQQRRHADDGLPQHHARATS